MTQGKTRGGVSESIRHRPGAARRRFAHPRTAARGLAVLVLSAACGCVSAPSATPLRHPAPAAKTSYSLVRVPAPDYASPAAVAAAFYVAWASADTVHDGPGAVAARCASLVTPQLERQLSASQPATAAWASMRSHRTVVLVYVLAVARSDGSPAPTPSRAYLRVYAERITMTTAGRTVAPDGVTVELSKAGRRWLADRVLFF